MKIKSFLSYPRKHMAEICDVFFGTTTTKLLLQLIIPNSFSNHLSIEKFVRRPNNKNN